MSKYISNLDFSDDPIYKDDVKECLSAWAKTFGDQFSNFGNEIEITSVFFMPTHSAIFQTLYEHRAVSAAEKKITDNDTAPGERTVNNTAEINPWDYKMEPVPEEMINHSLSIIVPGSKYIESCPTCSTKGVVTCHTCGGKKEITCENCGGKGKKTCSTCSGSGRISCGNCHGSGRRKGHDMYGNETNTSCGTCGGSGKKSCTSCGGDGKRRCNDCGGAGHVKCRTCQAKGVLVCQKCDGRGKILKFIRIDQKYLLKPRIWFYHDKSVQDGFPEFTLNLEKSESELITSSLGEQIANDFLEGQLDEVELKRKNIKPDLEEKLSLISQECPEGILGNSTYIRKQLFRLEQHEVYFIYYNYRGQPYSALIWGQFEFVYTDNSPFKEARNSFFEDGQAALKRKKYGLALEFYEKARDMTEDESLKKDFEDLVQLTIVNLRINYLKGIRRGTFLGIMIASFLFFILPQFQILPRTETVAEFHRYILIILNCVATFFLGKRLLRIYLEPRKKIIKSDSKRLKIGILLGLGVATAGFVITALINSTGLLNIITVSLLEMMKM